jgi:membrane protein required for colicin V production
LGGAAVNWLDIVIIVIAMLLGLLGLWQGAIKAAFGIAGLVGGIALAGHYYMGLASVFSSEGAAWARIAAYALILVGTLVIASVIGWFVAKLVHITMLGWVDRLIGFVLGAIIGGILCAAIVAIVSKYLPGTEGIISHSVMARFLMQQFPLLLALLPEEFDFIHNFFSPST